MNGGRVFGLGLVVVVVFYFNKLIFLCMCILKCDIFEMMLYILDLR